MDRFDKWKQLKYWQKLLRELELNKRGRIIDDLEKQISNKKAKFEERKKKAADEEQKTMQDIEKREKQLLEKRKELELEKIIYFDIDDKN